MKKRIITIVVAAAALLTLTASPAAAIPTFNSASGVLVRHDDGYIITGTLRDADGQVFGTLHGTLTELTMGFNSCPYLGMSFQFCEPPFPPPTCNLLGGHLTFNFQGVKYDAEVFEDPFFQFHSTLCQVPPANPTTYQLDVFAWSFTHTPEGEFPDVFNLFGPVRQISPNVFKWSS
jgi:hypothetical protein